MSIYVQRSTFPPYALHLLNLTTRVRWIRYQSSLDFRDSFRRGESIPHHDTTSIVSKHLFSFEPIAKSAIISLARPLRLTSSTSRAPRESISVPALHDRTRQWCSKRIERAELINGVVLHRCGVVPSPIRRTVSNLAPTAQTLCHWAAEVLKRVWS